MFGTSIFGSSSLAIFGISSNFGEVLHRVLLGLAITLGVSVIASFVITRVLKRLTK
jgi:hypothetical protein